MGVRRFATVTLVLSLLLAACSSTSEPPVGQQSPGDVVLSTTRDEPTDAARCDPPSRDPADRAQRVCVELSGTDDLAITTFGSTSCARVPASVSATSSRNVRVAMVGLVGPDGSCTADDQATRSLVTLPDGLDGSGAITVDVVGAGLDATLTVGP